MAHYTKFFFRAKLRFDLSEPIRAMLRKQAKGFQGTSYAISVGDGPSEAPDGINWAGWQAITQHPFFLLPRAHEIPGEDGPQVYREFDNRRYIPRSHNRSSHLTFTTEFKNYNGEIEQFLDWIKPYVRLRYGKRSRGHKGKVWVGYMQTEFFTGRIDIYIKQTPVLGVIVELDYQNTHD